MSGDTLRSNGSWRLSIDFGTSYTAAATERSGRITSVLFDGSPRIPSVVAVDDQGAIVVGAVAEREMARAPARAERCPKRRIGDAVMLLGTVPVSPVDAVAAVLRYVFDEAVHQSGGARPAAVVLTHPARWGSVRLGVLAEAARRAGLPEPEFVSEPVAAAAAESEAASLGDGQAAAVFDLGGGTFDTAVVRRIDDRFEVIGPPGGNDRVGGEAFDERIFVHLGELLAQRNPEAWEQIRFNEERTWRRAAFDFRVAVRAAKEALSTRVDSATYLGAPIDAELRLTRDELERLISPDLHVAVAELAATVEAAGLTPTDLRSVFLVGGSSRIPLASRLVGEWFGRVPITWGDPKGAVVLGALMVDDAGRRRLGAVPPTTETAVIATDTVPTIAAAAAAAGIGVAPVGGADAATTVLPVAPVSPYLAASAPVGESPVGSARRRPWLLAAAAVAVLAIGGTALAMVNDDDGGDRTAGTTSDSVSTTAAPTSSTSGVAPVTTDASSTSAAPGTTAAGGGTTTPVGAVDHVVPTAATSPAQSTGTSAAPATATTVRPTATTARPTATTARPTVTAAPGTTAAPITAAPVTAAPTTPPPATTTPPTAPPTTAAPDTVMVPNVIGADFAAAQSAIQSRGLVPARAAGACEQSSTITGYNPSGEQLRGTTITLWCE